MWDNGFHLDTFVLTHECTHTQADPHLGCCEECLGKHTCASISEAYWLGSSRHAIPMEVLLSGWVQLREHRFLRKDSLLVSHFQRFGGWRKVSTLKVVRWGLSLDSVSLSACLHNLIRATRHHIHDQLLLWTRTKPKNLPCPTSSDPEGQPAIQHLGIKWHLNLTSFYLEQCKRVQEKHVLSVNWSVHVGRGCSPELCRLQRHVGWKCSGGKRLVT